MLKLQKLLEKANSYIISELRKTSGVYTKERYNDLAKSLKKIAKDLKDVSANQLDPTDLIENEIKAQYKYLTKLGKEVNTPLEKTLRASVQFTPFAESSNLAQYLDSIETNFFNTWDNAIRIGYITGEPTQKIISSVMGQTSSSNLMLRNGSIQQLRNSIERNTRTYLQSVSSITKKAVYKENEKYFSGYKYLATLDRRTCLVCATYDNKIYKTLDEAPTTPVHYNCRCVLVPIVKGLDDLTIEDDTRASEEGEVSEKLNFNDWLKGQSEEVQLRVLGQSRFELYKKNENISQFVNSGMVLPLSVL